MNELIYTNQDWMPVFNIGEFRLPMFYVSYFVLAIILLAIF